MDRVIRVLWGGIAIINSGFVLWIHEQIEVQLYDYKVFCFSGEPKLIQVDYDRFDAHKRNIYDLDWKYIDVKIQYPTNGNKRIRKPKKIKEMLDIASKLSEGIPYVRVDFYNVQERIYFGEITFYHGSGFEKIRPESFNEILGNYIII